MSDNNPHGFPGMKDLLDRSFRKRREAALAQWASGFPTADDAERFLSSWSEAIAEGVEWERLRHMTHEATEAEVERRRIRTETIPAAYIAAGAAARDVRLWLNGARIETEAFKATRALLAAPGDRPFLVLAGAVGVGKTCGATLALLDYAAERADVWRPSQVPCFWNAAEVALGALLGKAAEEKLARAVEAPVLVIEDLGLESIVGAELWLSMLSVVVDARYRKEAITIITTNLTMQALRERYKERIADRLRQCARLQGCEKHSLRTAGM